MPIRDERRGLGRLAVYPSHETGMERDLMIRFSVLRPKPIKDRDMTSALVEGMDKFAKEILKDYERTVRTWNHQVKFISDMEIRKRSIVVHTGTQDDIWNWVDRGTRRHPIFPKRKKWLRFQPKYRRKTRVNVIGSWPGGPSGPFVFAGSVMHPGTKARNFTKVLLKRWKPKLTQMMKKQMKKAVRVSGHSLSRGGVRGYTF